MVYYTLMGLFDRFLTNQTIAPTVPPVSAKYRKILATGEYSANLPTLKQLAFLGE